MSLPPPPISVLSRLLPVSVSAPSVPMTFSMPVLLESVIVWPVNTVCAEVLDRSTVTALVTALKSSVSLSTPGYSLIVSLPPLVLVTT